MDWVRVRSSIQNQIPDEQVRWWFLIKSLLLLLSPALRFASKMMRMVEWGINKENDKIGE